MIASVRGTVTALGPDSAVVELGGVGLAVHCTPTTLATLRTGAVAALATSLVVREDSLTLYGFADADEKALFELLQTASGVGPRLAQAVLAVHTPDAVRRAVAGRDIPALVLVPGIGKKGAERLILELADRLGPPAATATAARAPIAPPVPTWREQVLHGLVGLGWSPREAEQAVEVAAAEVPPDTEPDVAVLLRRTLRLLGPAR